MSIRSITCIGGVFMSMLCGASAIAADLTPPLKRVSLSSAGVGYFEHEMEINGATTLTLSVARDQIDDVLKSLTVTGAAGGAVSVRMPGSEPLERSFRDLPFTPAALSSPIRLLSELRGSEVIIEGPRAIRGQLMAVEAENVQAQDSGRTILTRTRVSVMTKDGLQQAVLQDVQSLRFADERLRDQVARALGMIAAQQENGPRQLSIVFSGDGKRTVKIGYVVATPIWKVAYRLQLGANDKGRLQGWAILENTSGRDWDEVDLTLLSGNPVTFRQPLYQAYYTDRPTIAVETPNRLLPLIDQGELSFAKVEPPPRPMPAAAPLGANTSNMSAQWSPRSRMMADAPPAPAQGYEVESKPSPVAEASESQSQIVLRLPERQTIASGQSLMTPIIDAEIPAIRHTMLDGVRPVIAVEIANNAKTGLPPGAITFYDQNAVSSYLGDGRIGALPPGEKRLVGFASDLNVRIMREPPLTTERHSAKIADNVVQVQNRIRTTVSYRMKSSAPEGRIVVIDVPRQPGVTLIEPKETDANVSLILNGYRIRHPLEAGKEDVLNVVTEQVRLESMDFGMLQRVDRSMMDYAYNIVQNGEIDAETKAIFTKLMAMKQVALTAEEEIQQANESRDEIVSEQERLRDNLARIPSGSDLQKRYLKQMAQQEDRMESLLTRIEELRAQKSKADAELRRWLSEMSQKRE